MRLPTACYRLQFRAGMDFDRAAALVPYLARLGISHLYASPLFTAGAGSTHGYDVTDPTEIDPAIGGRAGLDRLSAALKAHGLGLVLDIVPNHMAFSTETPWLRDVLRRGRDSRWARHFDLDPSRRRIRLPWLAAPFETLLAEAAISVGDGPDGLEMVVKDGPRVPLSPAIRPTGDDADALRALHAAQHWRLVHWRTEMDALTHRRFFNVTSLVGVRIEVDDVYDDVHRLLFELVDGDVVHGIRIDHVDGLADPGGYLDKLRARVPDTPIWVEKILTGPELLPPSWPIQGETGYAAARAFNRLLTEEKGLERIDEAYREATGRTDPVADVLVRARRQIMTQDLAAELWALNRMFSELAETDPFGVEFGPETLRNALLAFIAVFPRYRTYMTESDVSPEDAALVARTADAAVARLTDPGAVPFLAELLTRDDAATAVFRLRFQQVTGAAVAKSQEDTAFYREVRLISTNEVGGEPGDDPIGIGGFHRAMERRRDRMPHGLTLTSSHDTKRSEDARMRVAAVTHAPDAFLDWHRTVASMAPEGMNPNLVWYLAQTFIGLDPADGDIAARLADHVVKALREAKSETYWTAPDLEIEEAAQGFARALAERFPQLPDSLAPVLEVADRLSLVQAALKLTVPGIPDIYQGCEAASYALTDPDNRREVDFDALSAALDGVPLKRPIDRAKFAMTTRFLRLRREHGELFLSGSYERLEAPSGICAFARRHEGLSLCLAAAVEAEAAALDGVLPDGEAIWPGPDEDAASPFRAVLTRK